MGGMLAHEAATKTGAADSVVATCLLDLRDPVVRHHLTRTPWPARLGLPMLRAVAGPVGNLRIPIRWLANMRAMSNDARLVDLVLHDINGGGNRVPLGFLKSYLESSPAIEPELVREPEFVLAHPADDRWTPVELSLRFFDRISAQKRLVLLDGAGHYPIETPGVNQLPELLRPA